MSLDEGTTNLYIKDCVFTLNDNGITGGTQDSQATVEFCEFNANGNTNSTSSAPTHKLYISGPAQRQSCINSTIVEWKPTIRISP